MSNNVDVIICGPGQMGIEYSKVLEGMKIEYITLGRGKEKAKKYENVVGKEVLLGGVTDNIRKLNKKPSYAIVAVNISSLCCVTEELINAGVQNILLEKPGFLNFEEAIKLQTLAKANKTKIFIAYNRRFYASTEKAMEIINQDGGVSSFNFEFTEWTSTFGDNVAQATKDNLFLANSTHVVDLAFYLGGFPKEMNCFQNGEWNNTFSSYSGAGVSDKNALFTYAANWKAPGRWSVEVLTSHHRLFFRPMEKLQIQEIGSVVINEVNIEDRIDTDYKAGLYEEVRAFLCNQLDNRLITLDEQIEHLKFFSMIQGREI